MNEESSPARERVLAAAERLFAEHGYAGVSMRDIAVALGMRQASLYHHVPGGKEQLFIEVTERGLARHRRGLESAVAGVEPELGAQLRAIAGWLLAQPPLDLLRLFRADATAIGPAAAERLVHAIYHALLGPLGALVVAAYERGEVRRVDEKLTAVAFLSVVESLHDLRRYTPTPVDALADGAVDLLLGGLRRR